MRVGMGGVRLAVSVGLVAITVAGCGRTVGGHPEPVAGAAVQATQTNPPTTTVEGPVPLARLQGAWTGTYTCNQGETEMTLTIDKPVSGSARTVFAFGPTTKNPAVPSGSFEMGAGYQDRILHFTQVAWIERPGSYIMVDLVADAVSLRSLSGRVDGAGCTTFVVTRATD